LWLSTRAQPALGAALRTAAASSGSPGGHGRWGPSLVALLKV